MLGGVKRLISHGAANQATDLTGAKNATTNHNAPTVGLWQNFAGLNLKAGESVVINGESVHFYSWGDSLPSVMQVLPAGVGTNLAFLRQIRAHEVWSMARDAISPGVMSGTPPTNSAMTDTVTNAAFNAPSTAVELMQNARNSMHHGATDYANPNQEPRDQTSLTNHNFPQQNQPHQPQQPNLADSSDQPISNPSPRLSDHLSDNNAASTLTSSQPYTQPHPSPTPEPPPPPEPLPNAWEVWTYLERQRQTTLKHLHTFRAEWEANRFVREAERSAPDHLRVHYEIRPVVLLADDFSHDSAPTSSHPNQAQGTGPSSASKAEPSSQVKHEKHELNHDDAIDVEILDPN